MLALPEDRVAAILPQKGIARCCLSVQSCAHNLKSGWLVVHVMPEKTPAVHSLENYPLHLHCVLSSQMCCGDCDVVAEPAECLHQHSRTFLLGLSIRFAAFLNKSCPLM